MYLRTVLSAIFIASLCAYVSSYKILGVFPTMAKSHFIVGSSLMKGLAEKGHEVTVISPFPQSKPIKNWRDIPTFGILEKTKALIDNVAHKINPSPIGVIMHLSEMTTWFANITLEEEIVQKFLRSNEKFDLIILEIFGNDAHLGFAATFKAPVIGISSFGTNIWISDMVGTPSPPSYIPNNFLQLTHKMNIFDRMHNLFITCFERIYNDLFYLPKQKHIYETMFPGDNKPDFYELRKNVSLTLINNHFSISHPRPFVPNMIEVGGMHINRESKPLPDDIKKFLDEASNGAIYFSMGSVVKSNTLPLEKREAFLKIFSKLKYQILWKWEDQELKGKPNNVMIKNWLPQDDILSHPNIKLFITHGGLLSTMEAIYHGVPVVGIPVYGDQFLNTLRTEKAGLGISLPLADLTADALEKSILQILNNADYSVKAKEISQRYRDQPMTPLQTAIYWVEYVARHKGASHLRSSGQDLSFIQYHNLDILAICLIALYLIKLLICALLKSICHLCSSGSCNKINKKQEKTNKQKKKN